MCFIHANQRWLVNGTCNNFEDLITVPVVTEVDVRTHTQVTGGWAVCLRQNYLRQFDYCRIRTYARISQWISSPPP